MKYKTLFRLMLKAIGMYIAANGLSSFVYHVGSFVVGSALGTLTSGRYWSLSYFVMAIPQLIQIALGAYLFFRGEWIVNLAIPSNRPYCPECAYDLTGAPVERCPECGTAFRWEDVRPKTEVQSPKFES